MGPCRGGRTEGPGGRGRRSEECLPSGRENVISWDQQTGGRGSPSPLQALTFPPCASHACRHTHFFSFSLSDTHRHTHRHTQTHTHTREWRKMTPFLSAISSVFTYPGSGYKRQPCVFMWQKHTEACVDWGEVNSLIHHSGLGLSEPHLGISLSTLRKWDCWRCLPSFKELQLSLVLRLTDDFSGESKFQS